MEHLKNKSRKVIECLFTNVNRSTITKSSKLYCYVKATKLENKAKFTLKCSEKFSHRIMMLKHRVSQYLSLFLCNKLTSPYKTQSHAVKYCEFK